MADQIISVQGLDEFIRATARVNKKAAGFVRKELRVGVGGAFVKDVKSAISAEGLVRSGKLRGSIRPAVKGSTLLVRSTPPLKAGKLSPMGYAAVHEFGGSDMRSVRTRGGGRGFSAVKNRSGAGQAARARGGARGALGELGPRAYMNPTLDDWIGSGKLIKAFNGALDNIEREYAS